MWAGPSASRGLSGLGEPAQDDRPATPEPAALRRPRHAIRLALPATHRHNPLAAATRQRQPQPQPTRARHKTPPTASRYHRLALPPRVTRHRACHKTPTPPPEHRRHRQQPALDPTSNSSTEDVSHTCACASVQCAHKASNASSAWRRPPGGNPRGELKPPAHAGAATFAAAALRRRAAGAELKQWADGGAHEPPRGSCAPRRLPVFNSQEIKRRSPLCPLCCRPRPLTYKTAARSMPHISNLWNRIAHSQS